MSSSSTEMKKITINRQEWFNGSHIYEGGPRSALWVPDCNSGCCLGHFLMQVDGLEKNILEGQPEPWELEMDTSLTNLVELDPEELDDPEEDSCFYEDKEWVTDAIGINDDRSITDEEREARLIELFKENGYELEFTN